MVTIEAEFKAMTFAGLSFCRREKCVFHSNPRDVEAVEDVVKWVKKVFSKGTDPMVTFGFFDECQHNFSRIFVDYKNGVKGIREIRWNGHGTNIVDNFHEKLTTKLVKELYLESADNYINYKEDKGE